MLTACSSDRTTRPSTLLYHPKLIGFTSDPGAPACAMEKEVKRLHKGTALVGNGEITRSDDAPEAHSSSKHPPEVGPDFFQPLGDWRYSRCFTALELMCPEPEHQCQCIAAANA